VNQAVTLTGLGYYADPTNGQVDANPVALYQCDSAACASGTLVSSATVTNTYPLTGHFRYVTVSPVTLAAGNTYEVAGVSFGDNYTWDDDGFTTNPAITYALNSDRWNLTSANGTPDFLGTDFTKGDVIDGYWGPNVFFGAPVFTGSVPEPATWAMMILGFGAIGLGIRSRRKQAARVTFA
jgi:hypothetical protein